MRDMTKIIKAGTTGTWNTMSPWNYTAKPGARVIVTEDCDTSENEMVMVKWIDELASGDSGIMLAPAGIGKSHLATCNLDRQQDGGYFHEDFVFDAEPVYDVNKTVEIVASVSQLTEIMEIGKLLSVLPIIGNEDPLYTRPYIQDACYCAYGWDVAMTNDIINAAVRMNLFKLI